MTTRKLLLPLLLSSLLCRQASARTCQSNPTAWAVMETIITNLQPVWVNPDPSHQVYGIQTLFVPDAGDPLACSSCHGSPVIGHRFQACGACHTSAAPDWLNFTSKDKLLRTSYYVPGQTKARASLIRATDGSMPPGALSLSATAAASDSVGWCDEIVAVYLQWMNAGYPDN